VLARLDDAEVEAVLGHELTHIRNGDVRLMVVAVIIAGAISFFAELFFRLWFYSGTGFRRRSSSSEDRGKGGGGLAIIIAVALIAVAWLLSLLIRFALSRSREFLADAGSVELTKNPDAMISALRKIEGRGELQGATSAVMELCVDNPREGFADLFSTHPSVESRVKALVETAGGHDPGPLALPPPDESAPADALPDPTQAGPTHAGPWGTADQPAGQDGPWGPLPPPPPAPPGRPFLPERPPIGPGGPWGKPGAR
jgi:heat shock protein HtpX